jgi:lysophospholipase L1-like esterase
MAQGLFLNFKAPALLTVYVRSLRSRRFVLFGSVCSLLAPGSFAQPPPPENQSAVLEIAEQITVDAIGAIFVFDQLFTKSATVTSPDYLQRVSEPSSKFYPDYLEYKQGRISRAELVGRLPHIAMLGDSLSKNMYISSAPSLFWRARTERRKNWFLDTDPAPGSIYSVYERLDKITPLVATEYSSGGARVMPGQTTPVFSRKLGRARNFSGQVNRVLRNKRFPDLVMICIGHNNANWVKGLSAEQRKHPEKRLHEIAREFGDNYTEQLQLLVDRAKTENHKVAIVVFGLVDFKTFFESRQKAAVLHASDRKRYPYIEVDTRLYEALKPAYQKNMARVAVMMNDELRMRVGVLNKESTGSNVRLQYSDAISTLDLGHLELLHEMDAWHPSRKGHSVLAQAAYPALSPSLRFLGIVPKQIRSP